MKAIIKTVLRPIWHQVAAVRQWFRLVRIYFYDFKRYSRYYVNTFKKGRGKEELHGWILQDKHRIEKALSLPQVRENFGEAVLKRLGNNLEKFRQQFDKDDVYYWGVGALQAYKEHHDSNGIALQGWFKSLYISIPNQDLSSPAARNVGTEPAKLNSLSVKDFKQFFTSRASTRCFKKDKKIANETFESITEIAIKSPSVCNRQHWSVHIVSGNLKTMVLKLQNGNAGFGHDAPHVAVITSSLKAFYLPAERVQAFTDGGMFAMSFLLSAHAHGVASCALNWAASLEQDISIRKLGIIRDDESVVMLIALGYSQEKTLVARSPRKSVSNILKLHP